MILIDGIKSKFLSSTNYRKLINDGNVDFMNKNNSCEM